MKYFCKHIILLLATISYLSLCGTYTTNINFSKYHSQVTSSFNYLKNNHIQSSFQSRIDYDIHNRASLHKKLSSLSAAQMAEYLSFTYGIETSKQREKVLGQLELYYYDSFIAVIKTFEEYHAFICALEKRMHKPSCSEFYTARMYGVKKKIIALKNAVIAEQKKKDQERHKALALQRQQTVYKAKIDATIQSQREKLTACKHHYQEKCDLGFLNDDQRVRHINRIKNIEQFFKQKHEIKNINHYVSTESLGFVDRYAQNKEIVQKLSRCYGNSLQQLAHKECIDALNQYSRSYKTVRMTSMHELMMSSVQTGCQLAESGYVAQAFSCADLCWAITDFTLAVKEGVFDGVSGVVNIALHPIETVENTVYGLATIGYYAGKTLHDIGAIGVNYCIDPELGKNQWSEYCDRIEKTCNVICDQLQELTVHDVVRGATAFAVEAFLMTKLLSSTHKVCRIAKSNITELVKATEVGEVIAVTAEGVSVKVANPHVQMFDTVAKKVIQGPTRYIELMHASVMQKVRQEIPHLRKLFDNKVKGFAEFANKYMKVDYEHILGMELGFTKKLMPKIKGFHHDFMEMVERSKLFEFVNKVKYKNDCYEAQILYKGNKAKHTSTFFPSDWPREKVVSKIYEAYKDFLKNGEKVLPDKGGKYIINGLTKEGIKIEICITKKGLIKSAYPILK